jgi:hypothetical protein
MKFNLIAGAAALAMLSTGALAQSSSSTSSESTTIQTPAVTAPASSYSQTKTEHKLNADGTEIDKKQSVDKTQSYGSSNGQLDSSSSTTTFKEQTVVPPAVSTTTRSSTTIEK